MSFTDIIKPNSEEKPRTAVTLLAILTQGEAEATACGHFELI